MKKLLILSFAILFALPFLASRTEAQISFVPYLGYNLSAGYDFGSLPNSFNPDDRSGALLVGVGAELDLPIQGALNLKVRPAIEYYFLSGYSESDSVGNVTEEYSLSQSRLQVNADVLAEFVTAGNITPYVGAGLIWSNFGLEYKEEWCVGGACDTEGDSESVSSIGFNLLGGIKLSPLGFGTPFVEVGYQILKFSYDDADFGITEELDLSGLSFKVGLSIPLGR